VVLRTEHMLGKDALSLSYALSPNPLWLNVFNMLDKGKFS
jgi:hypothetical protein